MADIKYSGVRESKPGRINDLGTTGKEAEDKFKKGCLKKADRSFAQGLQCQQINSMAALMSLEDSVFISHSPQGCVGCSIMAVDMYRVGQAHRGIRNIRACSHKNTTHVFSANFAVYCVENICRALARLRVFALYPPKLRSKIRTFILCEHALRIHES